MMKNSNVMKRNYALLALLVPIILAFANVTLVFGILPGPYDHGFCELFAQKAPNVFRLESFGAFEADEIDTDSIEFQVKMADESTIEIDIIRVVIRQGSAYLILSATDLSTVPPSGADKTEATGTINNGAESFYATGPPPAWMRFGPF